MPKRDSDSKQGTRLRAQAQKRLSDSTKKHGPVDSRNVDAVIHELQVHQVELEMQNEALRKAQIEIEESQEKYADFYDFAPVGYLTLDEEGLILELNLTAADLLGVDRQSLKDKPFSLFISPESQDTFYHHRKKVLGSPGKETCELALRKRDGTRFYGRLESMAVRKKSRSLIRSVLSDTTELKRFQREALDFRREVVRVERLARMGELTGSLAHKLNQPLTSILSNAQAALRFIDSGTLDADELKDILQDIVNDDKRAGNIIRTLRSIVKPNEGEQVSASLNDILREGVSLFHSEAIIRNIQVETVFADPLPKVNIDKAQLQQVMADLLMNAAEAMLDEIGDRKITLRTEIRGGDKVRVAVSDRGSGVKVEDLGKILEPFFITKGSGLGMGLSLSRTIIEAHGGNIWVENNPDKGATFYFELPALERGDDRR